jgi:hypothetical protein
MLHAMCMNYVISICPGFFFTLDRFGQQADGNIAPGGMFFYVFKVSRAAYLGVSYRQLLASPDT